MTDTIVDISLDAIQLRNRLRNIDEPSMLAVAASFAERGQDQPILCRPVDDGSNKQRLVAGAHRVAAARYLEWSTIKAIVRPMSDDEARLAEIDENVIRRELSALDRAVFLAERKVVYERLHPETRHGGDRKKKDQVAMLATCPGFSKDAAKKTGLSERSIRRATGLMMALSPEIIPLLRSTKLADNGGALNRLARYKPDQQMAAVQKLLNGEAKTLQTAMVSAGLFSVTDLDPTEKLLNKWVETLSRVNATTRRALLQALLRSVRPGEVAALANMIVDKLPVSRQKPIHAALTEALAPFGEVE
jgi:ParB family transcriptional regulator, chromosome partitioning protein